MKALDDAHLLKKSSFNSNHWIKSYLRKCKFLVFSKLGLFLANLLCLIVIMTSVGDVRGPFARTWPAAAPTNMQLAYTITVCQILLNEHYEKLTMSDEITKNRLNKNIVSKI